MTKYSLIWFAITYVDPSLIWKAKYIDVYSIYSQKYYARGRTPRFRSYPVTDSLSICFYYNNYLTFSSVIILYYYLYNGTRVGTCRYLRVSRTPIIITYRTSPGHDNRPAIIIMRTEIISLISPTSFIFLRWSCASSTYLTRSVDIPNCYVEKKNEKNPSYIDAKKSYTNTLII